MLLRERDGFLHSLRLDFEKVVAGEGHTVFVSGEAGIGKTSLVREFARQGTPGAMLLQGTCDALFTPRPLAPVYDVLTQLQMGDEFSQDTVDRTKFFSLVFQKIEIQSRPVILIFEDVHWADEASIDFIKFLARRIAQLRCLFILTFRDNETDAQHPLRAMPGQLSPNSFTRLRLTPFSLETVNALCAPKGLDGKEVFSISCGNPFYVNEILANYSAGIPEKVKDSILSVFNVQEPDSREAWKLLSVLPQGLPLVYCEILDPTISRAIGKSLEMGILVLTDDRIRFKHELYRRTIEVSLSPLLRISLNRTMLNLLQEREPAGSAIEQIIHFAKNANEGEVVVKYAPESARKAADVGAHVEASRLYLSAIEYYQGNDPVTLLRFYEAYAYECYLTNRIDEAIIYTTKALGLWQNTGDTVAAGNSLRFLSRLWWYGGNNEKAEKYGLEAIDVFSGLPASPQKGMAYSNMSQLKMLSDDMQGCLKWGEMAIGIARSIGDNSTLSHALNNVGTTKMRHEETRAEGAAILKQSLQIALDSGYHEHAARAYTNICSNAVVLKNYKLAKEMLDQGIRFCEERDLDSWSVYMSSMNARLCLETGRWSETRRIAAQLLENKAQSAVSKIIALIALGTVRIRTGEEEGLSLLLEALDMAAVTREPQRLIPALAALLEWEWISETTAIESKRLDEVLKLARRLNRVKEDELDFWLLLTGKISRPVRSSYAGYLVDTAADIKNAAIHWRNAGNSYQQAICLFMGDEEDQRAALELAMETGAQATAEKMKRDMRMAGYNKIPRGKRKSTRENPSQLTVREIELLPLLRAGLQNKEIAARLFISPKTVDHHISSIYSKLEVKSRASAVKEAIRLKIID